MWDAVKDSSDVQDLRDYLAKYPNGADAAAAQVKLRRLEAAKTAAGNSQPASGASNSPNSTTRPQSSTYMNKYSMEFALIPAGRFSMGSASGGSDEKPVHEVTIGQPFYIGKYEVTQGQWTAVMGKNPSYFKGDNLPVEQVSWDDAQQFINKLNEMNDGFKYRLPTEAEWEYSCRAGTTGDYPGDLDEMGWYVNNSGNGYFDAASIFQNDKMNYGKRIHDNGDRTHAVGAKQANAFGLYDMHGNVWEWCEDWHHENYNGAPTDGSAWLSGGEQKFRVLRGGSVVRHGLRLEFRESLRADPGQAQQQLAVFGRSG